MAGAKNFQLDEYYVFIVGHDMECRCDVANAMIKDKSKFKQFRSRRNILVKEMKSVTVAGHHLNIALTPTLNTPAWTALAHQIKINYPHRIFVYVKDKGIVDADDLNAVKKLKTVFPDSCILLVVDTEDVNKEIVQGLIKEVGEKLSFKFESTSSFESKTAQANSILKQIKLSIEIPIRTFFTTSDRLEVGAESNEQVKATDQPKDQEASMLVGTVNVQKERRRPTSEWPLVKTKDEDWQLFQQTLINGKAKSNHVRVNVVGNQGVGKSTLVGRLQYNEAEDDLPSTETLDINRITSRCLVVEGKRVWDSSTDGYEQDLNLQRMAEAMKGSEKEHSTNIKDISDIAELNLDVGSEECEEDTFEGSSSLSSEKKIGQEKYYNIQKRENYLQKVLRKKNYSRGERMYVSYWDYAGQSTYYSTHQAFLSPSAVYLLVVDLSQDLDLNFTDSLKFRTGVLKESTVAESIHFWISSIDAYTTDKDGGHAPVLLVGTHRDKVTQTRAEEMFKQIRELIQIDIECIAIDNTLKIDEDGDLDALRDRILDVGLGIVDEKVPAQWIDLESVLLDKKFDGTAILTFAQIEALDNKLDVPLNDSRRLDAFLEHQHCRGHLMFFHHENKDDLVILDPMILAKFLNELLRKTSAQSPTRRQSGWNHNGMITKQYIQDVAHNMKECHGIADNVDDLLSVLVKLHILIVHRTRQDHYFLPCLLPEKPRSHEECDQVEESAPRVDVEFEDKHMPPAFYHLLVSAMHKKYSILHIQTVPQIYNKYTCFCVGTGETMWLELSWIASRLCIEVKNFSKKKRLMTSKCHTILDDIEHMIEDVLRTYRHDNVGYKFRIECPKHKHPYYVQLETLKEDDEAMCTACEARHAVTLKDATGIYFAKEMCEFEDERLCKTPSDKDLGRLARHFVRESALSLARLMRMSNCITRTDRIIQNSGQNDDIARLKILQIWRDMYPNHTTGTLCNKLTKSGDYDKATLVKEVKDDDEQQLDHGLPSRVLETVPNDRVVEVLARNTDKNYKFVLLELGIQIRVVERIEMDNKNDMLSVIRRAIHKWRELNASNATLRRYLDVLHTLSKTMPCYLVPIVEDIRRELPC